MISSVTFPFTFCDTYTINAITDSEPITAAIESAISPINPNLLSATPPRLPLNSTTKATPILAPELIPSTEGPASGFRKTVCICKPLIARPAPATKAVNACGRRDFQTIFCQVTGSSPSPQIMFQTDFNGIDTDPNTRFRNIRTRIDATMSNIRKEVECLIRAIYLSRA